jgi:hypothetical protein
MGGALGRPREAWEWRAGRYAAEGVADENLIGSLN